MFPCMYWHQSRIPAPTILLRILEPGLECLAGPSLTDLSIIHETRALSARSLCQTKLPQITDVVVREARREKWRIRENALQHPQKLSRHIQGLSWTKNQHTGVSAHVLSDMTKRYVCSCNEGLLCIQTSRAARRYSFEIACNLADQDSVVRGSQSRAFGRRSICKVAQRVC